MRALLVARRSAIKSRTQAELQLRSLIVELDDHQRASLDRRRIDELATACVALTGIDGTSLALSALARRWHFLDAEVQANTAQVEALVRQGIPRLLTQPGIGPITAAQLLVTAGDNPERLTSEAAFAALCGVSPVEHSSGKTQRHRFNLGGDKAANSALWTIANNRLLLRDRAARAQPFIRYMKPEFLDEVSEACYPTTPGATRALRPPCRDNTPTAAGRDLQ